jgi:hypothetical protein
LRFLYFEMELEERFLVLAISTGAFAQDHAAHLEEIPRDPDFSHVCFDISWDEVAKYVAASPEATRITTGLIER